MKTKTNSDQNLGQDLDRKLEEMWPDVYERTNAQGIACPEIIDDLTYANTACFNFENRKTSIARDFVIRMAKHLPISASLDTAINTALRGILEHEVGHWKFFPCETWVHVYLVAEAEKLFKQSYESTYCFYSDTSNELFLMRSGVADDELARMRLACSAIAKDDASKTMNKLMAALYQHHFKFKDLKIPLDEKEQGLFEDLKKISFMNETIEEHVGSMYTFGKLLEKLITEYPPKEGDSVGIGMGDGKDSGKSGSSQGGSGAGKIILTPGYGSDGSLDNIPGHILDGALTEILGTLGKRAYEDVKGFLKKVRPDYKDPFEGKESDAASTCAGLSRADFKKNDHLIPLYERWASSHPLYIVKRPIMSDSSSMHIEGKKEYEVGDPLHRLDIYGSRGFIGVPGLSKTWLEEQGTIPSLEWSIPNLLLGIDTSSSMPHPGSRHGAMHVLAAAIIGRNYYMNQTYDENKDPVGIGAWNFSSDMAFLPPSRNINAFYSMICAYWGGGTLIDTKKLMEFIKTYEDGKYGLLFSDEKDYERVLDRLPISEEEKKQFVKKDLNVNTSKFASRLEKLDNVLITDGYIANIEEVMYNLSSMAKLSRNFVFLTNKEQYKVWSKKKLPNTWIELAEKPKDLIGLALGRSRKLVEESESNYVL